MVVKNRVPMHTMPDVGQSVRYDQYDGMNGAGMWWEARVSCARRRPAACLSYSATSGGGILNGRYCGDAAFDKADGDISIRLSHWEAYAHLMEGLVSRRVATIQTDDGEVFTGAVQDTSPSLIEAGLGVLFPPVGALIVADALWPDNSHATVKVNGETYRGKIVR